MAKDRVNFTLSKEGQSALKTVAQSLGLSMSAWIEVTAREAEKRVLAEKQAKAS